MLLLHKTAIVVDKDPAIHKAISRIGRHANFSAETFSCHPDVISWLDGRCANPATDMHAYCLVMDIESLNDIEEHTLQSTVRDIPKILTSKPNYSFELNKLARTTFFDFIEKPFSIERIQQSLLSAFAQHEKVIRGVLQITERFNRLTVREYQVGTLVVMGLTNQEIGSKLGISIKTVKAHRAKVMKKTESETLVNLIRYFDSYLSLNIRMH